VKEPSLIEKPNLTQLSIIFLPCLGPHAHSFEIVIVMLLNILGMSTSSWPDNSQSSSISFLVHAAENKIDCRPTCSLRHGGALSIRM
jgi:hypothetical protein